MELKKINPKETTFDDMIEELIREKVPLEINQKWIDFKVGPKKYRLKLELLALSEIDEHCIEYEVIL